MCSDLGFVPPGHYMGYVPRPTALSFREWPGLPAPGRTAWRSYREDSGSTHMLLGTALVVAPSSASSQLRSPEVSQQPREGGRAWAPQRRSLRFGGGGGTWLSEGRMAGGKAQLESWSGAPPLTGFPVCPSQKEPSAGPHRRITLLTNHLLGSPLPSLLTGGSDGPTSPIPASPLPHLCPLLSPGRAHLGRNSCSQTPLLGQTWCSAVPENFL